MAKTKGKTDKKDLTLDEKINLQSDLRRFGYLLPTNEEEVEEFDKIFGKTQVMFPDRLKEPKFLRESKQKAIDKPAKVAVVSKSLTKTVTIVEQDVKKPAKSDYFKKLVLAAHVAKELHSEPTFGHIKFVKVYMLCDKVCHMNLSSSYKRFAAGPLDPKQMRVFDAQFKKKRWFTVTRTNYGAYKYAPDEKIEEYQIYYGRYFRNQTGDIARIIDLFRKQTSDFCEVVATLFFVWMDLMSNRSLINNASLIRDFYAWDERKKRFDNTELIRAIEWMNENGIVPA
ncbi:MAG TPA: hypothetical protein DDZ56_01115 [Cytophagales bacterium]|nr:hypothetical protein [Cytophagales bacterium]